MKKYVCPELPKLIRKGLVSQYDNLYESFTIFYRHKITQWKYYFFLIQPR